jgi:27-O-demethylrifamycin SV methyltransferase
MGITTSEVGVQSALARAAAAGLEDRVRFDRRDATDNGFADRSFDRVWVLESSHLIRDRDRLFAECARVLRPEGRLALCDIVLMRDLPLPEVVRLLEPLTLLRDVFGDARMERLEQYVGRATRHGLVVDRVEDLTVRTRPTFARWRDNARRHRDDVSRTIGDEGWRQFVAATEVLERFWDDGTLGYGLLAAAKPA